MNTQAELPAHLKKYIIEQSSVQYTPVDQSVWRYILKQLRDYLSTNAHESYLDGLETTGVSLDQIPKIQNISEKLAKLGWRAMPVSGFIPPAAFMELQSLNILPIASDIRSLEHLLYTPAPDIVHEAAGHAPMLANKEFSNYLQKYAQIARKAIISKEDLEIYMCIRVLSDLKENPNSTPELIAEAEQKLKTAVHSVIHVSEATWLSRMNWWTAEYGLIGTLENPKIYGAGLLSSVGESQWCLSENVKKIPFSIDCINYSYDITEPQPQLFVTPDFETLSNVLDELADRMAFKIGGLEGLKRAEKAQSVCTYELNSGLQISGMIGELIGDNVAYLKLQGESQLSLSDKQIPGHGRDYHKHGFGTPIGFLKKYPDQCPSTFTNSQWLELGAKPGQKIQLEYSSGVHVLGTFESRTLNGTKTVLISLSNATATFNDRVLFEPGWGIFDIALGSTVTSVFGGPADRAAFGDVEDFVAARVPEKKYSEMELARFQSFEKLNQISWHENSDQIRDYVTKLVDEHKTHWSNDWLFFWEVEQRLGDVISNKGYFDLRNLCEEVTALAKDNSKSL